MKAIKKDNQLVESQMYMASELEQTNRVPEGLLFFILAVCGLVMS